MSTLREEIEKFEGRENHRYTFCTCCGEVKGKILEIGDDYIRIRVSKFYRGHEDQLVPISSICSIKEYHSSE